MPFKTIEELEKMEQEQQKQLIKGLKELAKGVRENKEPADLLILMSYTAFNEESKNTSGRCTYCDWPMASYRKTCKFCYSSRPIS